MQRKHELRRLEAIPPADRAKYSSPVKYVRTTEFAIRHRLPSRQQLLTIPKSFRYDVMCVRSFCA